MNLNIAKILEEYKSKFQSGEIFSKSDNQILIELLAKSNDQFESSSIIETLGQISWSRKYIETEYIDQVHTFLTDSNRLGFGSFAARSACEWIFTQWIGIDEDTVKKYIKTFTAILKGSNWDKTEYDAQPIMIAAAGNYLQNHKNKQILAELIELCDENKSRTVENTPYKQSILNLNCEFRHNDSILALKTALKIQEKLQDTQILILAKTRLGAE